MPELIGFCGLVVELHMHTNVYAVYTCGCSLSVTCQVAMVYNLRARLKSSDYTRTLSLSYDNSLAKCSFSGTVTNR